jgi:hypothetical protein
VASPFQAFDDEDDHVHDGSDHAIAGDLIRRGVAEHEFCRDAGREFFSTLVGRSFSAFDDTVRAAPVALQHADQRFESTSILQEAQEADSIAQAVGVKVERGNILASVFVEGGQTDEMERLHIEAMGRGRHVDVAGGEYLGKWSEGDEGRCRGWSRGV